VAGGPSSDVKTGGVTSVRERHVAHQAGPDKPGASAPVRPEKSVAGEV
jgi:hypothetical protein